MVGYKIDRAMRIITKGKPAKATMTWRQAHFSVVMFGSLQLPLKCTRGDEDFRKGTPPSTACDPTVHRGFAWMMSRSISIPHGGSLFLYLEP